MLDLFRHTRSSSLSTPCRHTVGPNVKNPPKIRFQKIVKLTDHSYACNSLTYSEYKTYPPGNRNRCDFAETCFKKLMKSHQVNLFLADLSHLEPLCGTLHCLGLTCTHI